MKRFVLTPLARADLEEIHDFIFLDSPAAAARVRAEILAALRRLTVHPQLGHLRQDLADEPVRFWAVYSYLVIYRPETDPLQVVRILRASRDFRSLLQEE